MNGDLGNLLTGEMGEAEARFADDDFAEAYGPRISGRVRRRRAVRAAGVGGGTMLTAGALVVGATHMPWGVLGATPGEGVGGTDCVTPSPAADVVTYTINPSPTDARSGQLVVTDAATGRVQLTGVAQSDGSYVFTDADGKPVEATRGAGGAYVLSVHGNSLTTELWGLRGTLSPSTPPTSGTITYTVEAPDGAALPSASDDCYTPSPAPSGVPSLSVDNVYSADPSPAAKPEGAVDSPFQCGFVMDRLGHGSSPVAITDTTWVSPAAYNASLKEKWGTSVDLPLELGAASIPTVRVRVDLAATSRWASVFGVGEPTDSMGTSQDGTPMVNSGASFVMVRDGVVVGTMDTTTQGAGQHFSFSPDGPPDTFELTLVNAAGAFVACPGQTLEPDTGTVFAVAGSYVFDKTGVNSTTVEYSWAGLERP